jgi:hypothetical protein
VCISLVVGGGLSAEGFPFCAPLFRELDTLDAAPAPAVLGEYLAHVFESVVGAAVITESRFRHQFS